MPTTDFKFYQEMPPRIILCVEYSAHLYQSRRLDHGILEASIGKFLAYDLIADTELALVLFGQQHSSRNAFKKLDSSVDSRLTLYNPPIDPFDELPRLYNEIELNQMEIQAANSQSAKLVKGTCSFAKVMAEAFALHQQRNQYDDIGTDIIIITSGLFIEDESKIEEILKSNFKSEVQQLNLIIYPSTMLFDTKSRDGFIVLDAIESEIIIRSRINKLLLIQRLTNAKIHLVKEHLDSNGDVKMSTLLQFYQIFDHISKGHSWDQTHSMTILAQQAVEARYSSHQTNGSKLVFQFELDGSIQNELIVGFIDPKHHHLARTGKRFAIKNLQLRSPGGHLILSDTQPIPSSATNGGHSATSPVQQDHHNSLMRESSGLNEESPVSTINHGDSSANSEGLDLNTNLSDNSRLLSTASQTESALFPYRTQLNLAGFHLKSAHLSQLNSSHWLAGTWTLSAISDEPIQTNGIAMARVNPAGDTVTANCWIQTYYNPTSSAASSDDQSGNNNAQQSKQAQLKAVKVFVQTKAGANVGTIQEVNARMEVQDEMGNIVQNVNMLDDGLGVPDMTRGDGIHSQYVQRAYRPGYYRVNVELTGSAAAATPVVVDNQLRTSAKNKSTPPRSSGQDNACCGSFIPSNNNQHDTRHLNRQLYCGTFYVDSNNRLAQQRPPRVNNLTIVNVDQENRRVTIKWFEPQIDISAQNFKMSPNSIRGIADNDLAASSIQESTSGGETFSGEPLALIANPQHQQQQSSRPIKSSSHRLLPRTLATNDDEDDDQRDADMVLDTFGAQQVRANMLKGVIMNNGKSSTNSHNGNFQQQQQQASVAASTVEQAQLSNRYEIKLFHDRDSIKRTFDSKQEVGFKFNEWNVEGTFPNASNYGGLKEVTLRIPNNREGIFYIAMKVYNNIGVGSQVSNIVQFWIRDNLTLEEAELIYGQSTTDAEGNVYDKNGELIHRGSSMTNYSLLKNSTNNLDGLSILVFISVLAFIFSIICISLVVCLASSARRSLGKRHPKSEDKKAVAASGIMGGAGSGSSMVSSNCGSSQQSEVASSMSGSQGGHDVEINKLSLGDELTYNQLQQQQQFHQRQAQLIQQNHQMISSHESIIRQKEDYLSAAAANNYQHQQQYQDTPIYSADQQQAISNKTANNQWPQHTFVNGYAYATVNGLMMPSEQQQQQMIDETTTASLNQNGLTAMSPVQSWPADILLSHYDKVKQARERNEAPPVMRIETLENQGQFSEAGLPIISDSNTDQQLASVDQSYLVRKQRNQMSSYFNQQLQQQLSSVLKSKQQRQQQQQLHTSDDSSVCQQQQVQLEKSSPALEGVTDIHEIEALNYNNQQQQHLAPDIPPPQYVYCTNPSDNMNGLQQHNIMAAEPSIYSQVTNLRQVVPSSSTAAAAAAPTETNYYANQWQTNPNSIYSSSSSAQIDGSYQATRGQVTSSGEDYAADKSNSAISEV